MKKFLKSREGFTLIELLVVIAIIGILAAVVVLAINPVEMMKKGRDSTRQSDLSTLSKALDIYIVDSQITGATDVPGTDGVNSLADSTCGSVDASTDAMRMDAETGGWLQANAAAPCGFDISDYISQIPLDPVNSGTLIYTYDKTASKYCLGSTHEAANNTDYEIGSDLNECP